jgi:outer membrane protein assembly factor BamB
MQRNKLATKRTSILAFFLVLTIFTLPWLIQPSFAQEIKPETGTTYYPWKTFQYNYQRTATTLSPGPASLDTILWEYQIPGAVTNNADVGGYSLVVAEGKVFVITEAGEMYAIDQWTGEKIWSFDSGNNKPMHLAPSYDDGMVYFGGEDEYFYALDASTGNLEWSYKGTGIFKGMSAVVNNGLVIAGTWDGYLYAWDAKTGALEWEYFEPYLDPSETYNFYWSAAAVYERTGTDWLITATGAGTIRAQEIDTGDVVWEYRTNSYTEGGPTVHDGKVFVAGTDGYYYAVDVNNGDELWKYEYIAGTGGQGPPVGGWSWHSAITPGDGNLYFGEYERYEDQSFWVALRESDGALMWQVRTDGPNCAGGVATVTEMFNSAMGGKLYLWDSTDLGSQENKLFDAWFSGATAIADGLLFAGSMDGKVYAIGELNGGADQPAEVVEILYVYALGVVIAILVVALVVLSYMKRGK